MKKILITGVCGFIGFNFANYLLAKNKQIEIVGVDNLNNYYSVKQKKQRLNLLKKNPNFIFIKIDISNNRNLKKIFIKHKFDLVINLAAQAGVRYSISNPEKYIESNTVGFFNILNNCKIQNIKKIIYASSSSVYGDNTKYPSKEEYHLMPNNFYSLTKKNNEEQAELYSKYYKLNLIGLRFFTVFGEWGRPDMMMMKYIKASYNKREKFYLYNKGNHYRDLTYIGDVNKILAKLINIKFKNHKIFNICSNNPVKLTKILKIIDNLTSTKPKIIKIVRQKADLLKTHGSNNKINKLIKFNKYTKLEVAIKNVINWYKNSIN